jgi:hypothetical protein
VVENCCVENSCEGKVVRFCENNFVLVLASFPKEELLKNFIEKIIEKRLLVSVLLCTFVVLKNSADIERI